MSDVKKIIELSKKNSEFISKLIDADAEKNKIDLQVYLELKATVDLYLKENNWYAVELIIKALPSSLTKQNIQKDLAESQTIFRKISSLKMDILDEKNC